MAFATESSYSSSSSGGVRVRTENGMALIELQDGRTFSIPSTSGRTSTSTINGKSFIAVDGKRFEITDQGLTPVEGFPRTSTTPIIDAVDNWLARLKSRVVAFKTIVNAPPTPVTPEAATLVSSEKSEEEAAPPAQVQIPAMAEVVPKQAAFSIPDTMFGIKSGYVLAATVLGFLLMRKR